MGQTKRGIGALNVVTTQTAHGTHILLGLNIKKNAWEVPGGKIEEDESVLNGVIRETTEETAQHTTLPYNIGYVDTLDEYLVLLFRSYAYQTVDINAQQPNPEDDKFVAWRWFNITKLPTVTWLSAEAIQKAFSGLIVGDKLPCPFKKKVKS